MIYNVYVCHMIEKTTRVYKSAFRSDFGLTASVRTVLVSTMPPLCCWANILAHPYGAGAGTGNPEGSSHTSREAESPPLAIAVNVESSASLKAKMLPGSNIFPLVSFEMLRTCQWYHVPDHPSMFPPNPTRSSSACSSRPLQHYEGLQPMAAVHGITLWQLTEG